MSDIKNHFILAIEYMIKHNLAKNKKEIALSLGQKPSNFGEVIKGRVRLNTELLDKLLEKYPINPLFLHGLSDEIVLNKQQPALEAEAELALVDADHAESSLTDKTHDTANNATNSVEILKLIRALRAESISNNEKVRIADRLEDIFAMLKDENSRTMFKLMPFLKSQK